MSNFFSFQGYAKSDLKTKPIKTRRESAFLVSPLASERLYYPLPMTPAPSSCSMSSAPSSSSMASGLSSSSMVTTPSSCSMSSRLSTDSIASSSSPARMNYVTSLTALFPKPVKPIVHEEESPVKKRVIHKKPKPESIKIKKEGKRVERRRKVKEEEVDVDGVFDPADMYDLVKKRHFGDVRKYVYDLSLDFPGIDDPADFQPPELACAQPTERKSEVEVEVEPVAALDLDAVDIMDESA